MKGDFSQWRPFDPNENFNGVLHQQGRVLLDQDWNDETRLLQHWQDRAAQDVIGSGVAAVPIDEPNGFKIVGAAVVNTGGVPHVELKVHPGHAWAGGALVYIGGPPNPVPRTATYLGPPIQNPAASPSTIGANVRDAVILEVSREALNGFQWPDRLIEPALGGPDTTERIQTRLAFRLLRLAAGEDCHTVAHKLKDDLSTLGRLTVTLDPPVTISGDCPVVEGGGYTGFEHQLYRIEVAAVNSGGPKFKWSRFNGGLVGRGIFHSGPTDFVEITANFSAIVNSALGSFYLEAVQFDAALGQWVVTYGARATLNNNNKLVLSGMEFGTALPAPGPAPAPQDIFFRLWDDLDDMSAFTNAATPAPLLDGIHLVFDAPASKTYREGDYWVFPARAGEINNQQTLINAQPPQGIRYHRVPLAELNWSPSSVPPVEIDDCRRPFRPLTKLDTCCTYRVGDGIQSFGDFNASDYPNATPIGAIQAAINALPKTGGQVCVLPGEFRENILMTNLHDVTITGCGPRSRVIGRGSDATGLGLPVIHVKTGANITIESLAVEAHETGIGILLEGTDTNFVNQLNFNQAFVPLINVVLEHLLVIGIAKNAIRAQQLQELVIRECHVLMRDTVCLDHAIFALGDDLLIERNLIEVQAPAIGSPTFTGADSAATFRFVAGTGTKSRGGIQIGGTSDWVRIINNLIQGGTGNGITLGSLIYINQGQTPIPPIQWPQPNPVDPCDPATPANAIMVLISLPWLGNQARPASAGTLTEILIERNRIYDMGMNGIGVVGFFDLAGADEFITVEKLSIIGNDIRRCLRRTIAPISTGMLNSSGYGGISLADVEQLVIRDNLIADNGRDHLEPVCGIFVLHAEGMEISRNRILNNGPKNSEPASGAKIGLRGGIIVVHAATPVVLFTVGGETVGLSGQPGSDFTFPERLVPGQNGEPALKVEGNIVSVPLGQALSVTALGPISVVANEFTSRGIVQSGPAATSWAATVAILNLGLSSDLDFLFAGFTPIANGSFSVSALSEPRAKPGLDDQRLGAYLANGNVLFANNQCVLDLLGHRNEDPFSDPLANRVIAQIPLSSIAIFSLDDIAFHGNQCDSILRDDGVITQVMLFGFSVRAHDNRLKESLYRAVYSALTLGIMNMTTHNQSTHCLLRLAPAIYLVRAPNTVLIDPTESKRCEGYAQVQASLANTGRG